MKKTPPPPWRPMNKTPTPPWRPMNKTPTPPWRPMNKTPTPPWKPMNKTPTPPWRPMNKTPPPPLKPMKKTPPPPLKPMKKTPPPPLKPMKTTPPPSSNWSPDNISSLWAHARTREMLYCPSQGRWSTVGCMGASDLTINSISDSSCWKSTTTYIGNTTGEISNSVTSFELLNVRWLQVEGKYGIHDLTEGMHYEVKIVVTLLSNFRVGPVTCTLTDPKGLKQVWKRFFTLMLQNQTACITIGQFCAHKSLFGNGEIKFSMVNTDTSWKRGLVVVGVLVVPVK